MLQGTDLKKIFPLLQYIHVFSIIECSYVKVYMLTKVRSTGGLFASSDLEETLSKRWTSLFWAKAIFLHGGACRQCGRRTQGWLFAGFTDFFIHILRQQILAKLTRITNMGIKAFIMYHNFKFAGKAENTLFLRGSNYLLIIPLF